MVIEMKINCFSVTFWFNTFDKYNEILNELQSKLKDEYETFNIRNIDNNLLNPIITAINNEKMTNLSISQINLQYNMDNVKIQDFEYFKKRVLELFEILSSLNVEISHTSLFINSEITKSDALNKIAENTINKTIIRDDLVDITLKLGKKEEDLFYKIITLLNKKQIQLPKKVDKLGRLVPIPLISWNGAFVENEIIDVSYEINDKYSFDFTKNYHTTEFYLNKMLYVLENNYEDDINNLIDNGQF